MVWMSLDSSLWCDADRTKTGHRGFYDSRLVNDLTGDRNVSTAFGDSILRGPCPISYGTWWNTPLLAACFGAELFKSSAMMATDRIR